MKKIYSLLLTVCASFILAACGMTSEEITTYMTSLEASYQNGMYEQAQTEIEALDKEYDKMTDEQKTKFDELKSSVEYALSSSDAINEGLTNAQNFLDQQMYFEASQELENLIASYTMPPAEQKIFDEKKAAADSGIKAWNATSIMQEATQLLNGGDYNAATEKLGTLDISSLSQEQQAEYQSIQTDISNAKTAAAAAQARAAAEAAARAEAERKANEGISASEAKSIVANAMGADLSEVTITDRGTYYSAAINRRIDGEIYESACKVDKKQEMFMTE